jgi:hypothetical protein
MTTDGNSASVDVFTQSGIDPESRAAVDLRIKEGKEAVLESLREVPFVRVAVKKAGIDKSTYYRWILEDKVFAKKAKEAKKAGMAPIRDGAISVFIKHGTDGNNWRAALELIKYIDRTSEDEENTPNSLSSILSNPQAIEALGEILKTVGRKMKKDDELKQ